jgi:hypothetical protein
MSIIKMRVLKLSLQFAAIVMLFIFLACASTKSPAVRKDEAYQKRPGKILVIYAYKRAASRLLFEDELVKALKERRIDAVVSYNIMPDPVMPDRDSDRVTIAAKAKEVDANIVLIIKPLYTRIDAYGVKYIRTQIDVYDMKPSRLALSITAETRLPEGQSFDNDNLVQSYTDGLVKELSRQGLF